MIPGLLFPATSLIVAKWEELIGNVVPFCVHGVARIWDLTRFLSESGGVERHLRIAKGARGMRRFELRSNARLRRFSTPTSKLAGDPGFAPKMGHPRLFGSTLFMGHPPSAQKFTGI